MPKEQEEFRNQVDKILEAVMFEQWLRFYFITSMKEEKDSQVSEDAEEHLFMLIPEKAIKKIEGLYPDLSPMADFLNNKEISFELSQRAVCTYVVENLDGKIMPRDTAPSIMDSLSFQVDLQLFNTWVGLHEDQLEKSFFEFGTWRKLFDDWKDSPSGHELMEKLILSHQKGHAASSQESSGTDD